MRSAFGRQEVAAEHVGGLRHARQFERFGDGRGGSRHPLVAHVADAQRTRLGRVDQRLVDIEHAALLDVLLDQRFLLRQQVDRGVRIGDRLLHGAVDGAHQALDCLGLFLGELLRNHDAVGIEIDAGVRVVDPAEVLVRIEAQARPGSCSWWR